MSYDYCYTFNASGDYRYSGENHKDGHLGALFVYNFRLSEEMALYYPKARVVYSTAPLKEVKALANRMQASVTQIPIASRTSDFDVPLCTDMIESIFNRDYCIKGGELRINFDQNDGCGKSVFITHASLSTEIDQLHNTLVRFRERCAEWVDSTICDEDVPQPLDNELAYYFRVLGMRCKSCRG